MPKTSPAFLLLVFAACTARAGVAQTTWTVDAAGGAQFTTIAAAVQAASDGDTILVLPGTYATGFTLTKGISIVGVGGLPVLDGQLTVTPPDRRTVSIANFASTTTASGFRIHVLLSLGAFHGEALTLGRPGDSQTGLRAERVASVTLRRCTAYGSPAIVASNATIACAESSLSGQGNSFLFGGPPALLAGASYVELTGCSLHAGPSTYVYNTTAGGTALLLWGYSVLRASSCSFAGGAGHWTNPIQGNSAFVDVTSTLVHDARCTFPDAIVGTGIVTPVQMCELAGTPAPAGGQATFTTNGPAGAIAMVAAALPAVPFYSPFGPLWLDPATSSILQFGPLPLPPVVIAIPAGVPRGTAFALQTGLLAGGAIHAAPPLVPVVH